MDGNKIGKNLIKLAEALNSNYQLKEIFIRSSEISKKDVESFLNILSPDTRLKKLHIEKNDFTNKSIFSEKLKKLPNLILYF